MNKRIKTLVASGVVVAGIAAAGFAYASFAQSQTAQAQSQAAKFASITVTGVVVDQNLLPGDASDVNLTITNPAGNTVKAKVDGITLTSVVVDPASIADPADAAGCAGYITADLDGTAANPNAALPTLNPAQVKVYKLNGGVVFGDAPIGCQGMSFTTTWTVALTPVK